MERRAVALELRDLFDPLCRVFRERVESEVSIDTLNYIRKEHAMTMKQHASKKDPMDPRLFTGHPLTGLNLGDFDGEARVLGRRPVVDEFVPYGGYYGWGLASNMVVTTALLTYSCSRLIGDMLDHIGREHASLIKSTDLGRNGTSHHIFFDGIRSVGNSFTLLTAEKVPGTTDYLEALETLTEQRFPNKLSLMMPFGLMGRLMLGGYYVHDILETGEDGELRLGKRFRDDVVARASEAYFKLYHGLSAAVGVGCPMGRRVPGEEKTGVEDVTDAFMHVFRIIDNESEVKGSASFIGLR